jgi:hypothetical protein
MKKRLNGFVALMVALLMTVVSTPASAQMPEPWWRVLNVKDVAVRINDLVKTDRGMEALARKLTADGFTAQDPVPQPPYPKSLFGIEMKYAGDKEHKPVTMTLVVQDYTKKSGEQSALGMATLSSDEGVKNYAFILIKTGKDFKGAEEYKVDEQFNVVRAHSFSTCFFGNLARCRPCTDSATSCLRGRSFADSLNCLFVIPACTTCVVGALACCMCNCFFFCSWATGCCHT